MAKNRRAENIANVKHAVPHATYIAIMAAANKLAKVYGGQPRTSDAVRGARRVFDGSRGTRTKHINLLDYSDTTLVQLELCLHLISRHAYLHAENRTIVRRLQDAILEYLKRSALERLAMVAD